MSFLRTRETQYFTSSESFNPAETQTLNLASVRRPYMRRALQYPDNLRCQFLRSLYHMSALHDLSTHYTQGGMQSDGAKTSRNAKA